MTLTPTCYGTASSDPYTLAATDATGATRTSVPFGTYSYTVTKGGTTTSPTAIITVGTTSVSALE